jgi:hypothetical protein
VEWGANLRGTGTRAASLLMLQAAKHHMSCRTTTANRTRSWRGQRRACCYQCNRVQRGCCMAACWLPGTRVSTRVRGGCQLTRAWLKFRFVEGVVLKKNQLCSGQVVVVGGLGGQLLLLLRNQSVSQSAVVAQKKRSFTSGRTWSRPWCPRTRRAWRARRAARGGWRSAPLGRTGSSASCSGPGCRPRQ